MNLLSKALFAPAFLVSGLMATSVYAEVSVQSVNSFKCMDVPGGSVERGAGIQQYQCNLTGAQEFHFIDVGHGYSLIVNPQSGLCLDVDAWSKEPGAPIIQWTCHGGDNQKFKRVATGQGPDLLVNKNSRLCLDVDDWSRDDGAAIIQWTCHGGKNQQWVYFSE